MACVLSNSLRLHVVFRFAVFTAMQVLLVFGLNTL